MIRVLVADDHPIVRQGLRQRLSESSDVGVSGEATDAQDTLDKARSGEWDVLVLDISMPGRNGFDILRELKYCRPDLPVLVLSVHSEEQFAVRALQAGAAGYLMKDSAPNELVTAIRKAVAGGKYVSPHLAEMLATSVSQHLRHLPHETLSEREFQVMRCMAAGKTPAEIADELSLSVKTVSTYRARILQKMNLKTNSELMRYAMQNELVD